MYLPRGDGIGVSARIEDEAERQRLKAAVAQLRGPETDGGYILRTAAQGATIDSLREDMEYLRKLWHHVRERARAGGARARWCTRTCPLPLRILRDELSRGVGRVLVDSAAEHARMTAFAAEFMPATAARIELHAGAAADLRSARHRGGDRAERSSARCRSNRAATWSSTSARR